MTSTLPRIAIIIPCFNEEAILPQSIQELLLCLTDLIKKNKIAHNSFLLCVDDGSKDATWSIIKTHHNQSTQLKGLKLSSNTGHQNAILAGLLNVRKKIDCAITIDADLQDDPACIETMIDHFQKGNDIIYGVRTLRNKDTFFKRATAIAFYNIMKKSGAGVIHNHADFRLLSKRAIHALSKFKERNLFLRGIFPLIGYQSTEVYYERRERCKGQSHYNLKKMIILAWDGITSFTHIPLNIIMMLGVFSFLLSLGLMIWALCTKLLAYTIPGWTSIMIPLCFMGGIQLLSIGVIGEYVAKVYFEVKKRPRFIEEAELE